MRRVRGVRKGRAAQRKGRCSPPQPTARHLTGYALKSITYRMLRGGAGGRSRRELRSGVRVGGGLCIAASRNGTVKHAGNKPTCDLRRKRTSLRALARRVPLLHLGRCMARLVLLLAAHGRLLWRARAGAVALALGGCRALPHLAVLLSAPAPLEVAIHADPVRGALIDRLVAPRGDGG